jgi:ADP-heptose:LPS heptosyltransferase
MLFSLGGRRDQILGLELWLSENDREYAWHTLAKNDVTDQQLLICMGIGATMGKRRWPIERFTELAKWLVETYDARILIVGDASDAHNAEYMRTTLGTAMINQAGACSLRESAALLSFCRMYIGNDTGPMHLAAASNVAVIELSCHPTSASRGHINSPARYRPLAAWSHVMQPLPRSKECEGGCLDAEAHCIMNLELSDVRGVFREFMQEQSLTRQWVVNQGA